MIINDMIPEDIKRDNALRFSQLHQSSLFEFDVTSPGGWEFTWNYLIDRVDHEQTPPTLLLEKDETRKGQEATFTLELGDVDAKWWLICHHFEITQWTHDCLFQRLSEDFYQQTSHLIHPETGRTLSLSEHITEFLQKYPNGGCGGVICDLSDLFRLQEETC